MLMELADCIVAVFSKYYISSVPNESRWGSRPDHAGFKRNNFFGATICVGSEEII
jgi:hypothetical protein